MNSPAATPRSAVLAFLRSADLARAFTLTVLATVFGSFAIERIAGRTVLITIVSALCVLAVAVLAARRREISPLRLVPTTLLLLLGWALASTAWSGEPLESFARWLSMAAAALLAVTIGHVRDTLQTVRALGDVSRALLGVSLALEIFSGILIDMPLRFLAIQGNIAALGPVQGIFGTRNMLGFVAVLALVTFVVEYRTQSVRPGISIGSFVLGAGMALLSASPSVFVLAGAVLVAAGALALVRRAPTPARRTQAQWILGGTLAVGLVTAWTLRGRIVDVLGAADDLAMRTELWSLSEYYVRLRPVQGWGWFGPWAQEEVPFDTINWILGESHTSALNAFYDVLLQLGWAGLLIFVAFLGITFVRSWLDAGERRSIVYAWTPLLVVAIGVASLFESFALFGAGWLVLVVCAVRAGQSRSWRERLGALRAASPGSLENEPG
jgi:exopolysaccharide production protein ExoQ